MYIPDITGRGGVKYLALADALSEAIESGELAANSKMPPQRILSYKLNVTVGTVTRAYKELEKRGLIEPRMGSGTFVKDRSNERSQYYLPINEPEGIDLALSRPWLFSQQNHLNVILKDLLNEPVAQAALLGYQTTKGLQGHTLILQKWLASRFDNTVDAKRLIWTYGAQHGLSLAVQSLSRSGDTILVEGLCYPEFVKTAQLLERKIVPVKIDEQGINPEDLALHCKRHKPKLLYITPANQNPTSVSLSDSRRLRVLEICRKYKVTILEDDAIYCPPESRKTPLFSIAPDLVVYIGSFSKYFAGGLRVGYAVVPTQFADLFTQSLRANCMHVSPLTIDLVCRWIENGAMHTVDKEIASEISARQKIWSEYFPDDKNNQLNDPAVRESVVKGSNVWLTLPEPLTGFTLAQTLQERGILVREAERFAVNRFPAPAAIRISLTGPETRSLLIKGLEILKQEIEYAVN